MTSDHPAPAIAAVLLAGGAWLYVRGWKSLRRTWAIRNLPTSRIRSVAMGMAEVSGKIRLTGGDPVTSPVRRLTCAWWRVVVTRTDTSTDSKGRTRTSTTTVLDLTAATPFHVEDATGTLLVVPDGAEVHGDQVCNARFGGFGASSDAEAGEFLAGKGYVPGFGTSYHVDERVLLANADAYILGEVGLAGPGAAAERRRRLAARLQAWLRDPRERAAVDLNADGTIQPDEWEAAKARAGREAAAEAGPEAAPAPVMRRPRDGYFMISAGSEKEALARHARGGWMVAAGVAAAIGGGVVLVRWLQA